MARGARSELRVGRLPADLTNFVGRRQEVASVKRLLSTARLVTLTGVGGTGKTRLAVRVADELRRGYPHGAWLVDLAPLPEHGLVECAVAEALGIRDRSGHRLPEVVAAHLRERQLLLVLDNCEHVLDACAGFVDPMLRSAPGLRVLCTSRQALGTISEHVVRVPPLRVPEAGHPLPVNAPTRYPSILLFAERAAAAAPDFVVKPDNQERVAEICRRLDGLPLAIELAAAQLRTLSLDQLAAQLGDRLRVLRSRYTSPAHHRTLEATFDWSFELCSAEEQALWTRLSVFVDSVDADAAAYVCGDGSPLLDVISGLVDKSVLLRDEAGGQVRYRLLDTVRQYGLSRLRMGGDDETALRRRHRDWYLDLAERYDADWFGPRQAEWSARMRRERSNVRAALDFCLTDGDAGSALRIASSLQSYWLGFSFVQEGRYWLDRVLAANPQPTPARAHALAVQARLLNALNEPGAAAVVCRECLTLAQRLAEPSLAARATVELGVCRLLRGGEDLRGARALLEEGLRRLGDGDPSTTAIARISLAMTLSYQGDLALAARLCSESREASLARDEKWWQATALICTGAIELRRGDPEAAEACLRDGLALMRAVGDLTGTSRALDLLATAVAARGDFGRVARLLGAAHNAWCEVGPGAAGSTQLRQRREETRERARTALGAVAFDAAFTKGVQMSVDGATGYALGEVEPDPAVPLEAAPRPGPLTPRELQVAGLIAQGLSNKQIAANLVVAQRTAESHVENILRKLEFCSRAQVAAWYAERARPAGR